MPADSDRGILFPPGGREAFVAGRTLDKQGLPAPMHDACRGHVIRTYLLKTSQHSRCGTAGIRIRRQALVMLPTAFAEVFKTCLANYCLGMFPAFCCCLVFAFLSKATSSFSG